MATSGSNGITTFLALVFSFNDDSRAKNILGKVWAEKSGSNYKYFMAFQTKQVENCYTASSVIEVLKGL